MAYTPINKSTDYFNTKLYTGTGSSQVITGIGFQPDFIWTKTRNEAEIHCLNTTVQGINSYLRSNAVDQLETGGSNITAQSSDGYTVGTEDRFNQSSNTFVSWNWKANGLGSSNTDGTINSTYTSASVTSGFSIVTYTGTGTSATIGHGLGVAPQLVIYKRTNNTNNWFVYSNAPAVGNTKYLNLDTTGAVATYNVFQNTDPSSSVLYVSGDSGANASTGNYIAYCFTEVQGFSKMGQYAGNGNANGGFIYCGFKPAFFMIKEIQSASDWHISFNNIATQQNPIKGLLYPNSTGTDSNTESVDFLSNGVKIRTSGGGQNESNKDYIYLAFAAAPLVGSNNVPANAR